MHSIDSRLRLAAAILLAASLSVLYVAALPLETDASAARHLGIRELMTGLACVESGGRFDALNKQSGSFGKYQIMPRNWPAWAGRYMGNRWAQPTPRKQEFVARMRVAELYEKRGSWRRAAYWWLTGDGEGNEVLWSSKAAGYVEKVMAIARYAASPELRDLVPGRCFPLAFDSDPKIRTEPFPRVLITGGRVNVRIAPGYENRPVAFVRRDDRVALLGNGADPRGRVWVKIGLHDGSTGWVAGWFVEPAR